MSLSCNVGLNTTFAYNLLHISKQLLVSNISYIMCTFYNWNELASKLKIVHFSGSNE